ncbi:hypothetical protein V8E54_011084 [Elaphomyces granulatus]
MSGEKVGFMAEPDCGRGTVGIIWSCLTTMVLCTYTVQHLNVPSKPKSKGKKLLRKLGHILMTLMIPEFSAVEALDDFVWSWKHSKRIRDIRGWEGWSLKQSHLLHMDGIEWEEPSLDLSNSQNKSPVTFPSFPSNDMINERSKADGVAKMIAICQTSWFVITIIFRLSQRMPLSLLEVLTVSYIFCALIMFICWFERPRDIQFRIKIEKSLDWPTEIRDYRDDRYKNMSGSHLIAIFSVFAIIFCGIHIAAWAYDFPTTIESWLWRSFSIALFVISVLVWVMVLEPDLEVGAGLGLFLIFLYIPLRLYIIVESFLAFRSANPAIYTKVGWSSYWGHVGS